MNKKNSIKKIPRHLKKGDKIAIISTARKINQHELNPSIEIIKSWGFEVVLAKNILAENHQFCGTIQQRSEDLQKMIDSSEIKAIICARGGYGTVKVIDKIDFTKLIKNPKWIIGYSDVTVLHSHLHQLAVPTLHSTMPINFKDNTAESLDSLRKVLIGETLNYEIDSNINNIQGYAHSKIVGGNLSILYSLCGSKSDIDTNGKILFIEDLDEYLYHIDRMITNLDRTGKLANLAGLIVGGMTKMHDNEIPFGKNAEEIILETVKKYNYPVCFNFPAGHIKNNLSLPLGIKAKLTVAQKTTLNYG